MLAPGEGEIKMNGVLRRALSVLEGFKRQMDVALGGMV